jgi:glutamate N-acetyltransferase/amino-acid N-acetyltransferase
MLLDEGASVAGVFTQNRFCAAPVQVCREHLAHGDIRALIINTGNANAGTGQEGLARAQATCAAVAGELGLKPGQVLPFSTGVIMEPLPVDRITAGLPAAIADARPEHWLRAAEAIMTTDTVAKAFSRRLTIDGVPITVTGISKGAGMIRPNMATMLGFLATDAKVAPGVLKQLATEVAEASFNRVTVDGDTSTNDSFVVIATNRATNAPISSLQVLRARRWELPCAMWPFSWRRLSFVTAKAPPSSSRCGWKEERMHASAGRWPTPLHIRRWSRRRFSRVIPTWGRILAAVGYAGIDDLDQAGIELYLDDVHVWPRAGATRLTAKKTGSG